MDQLKSSPFSSLASFGAPVDLPTQGPIYTSLDFGIEVPKMTVGKAETKKANLRQAAQMKKYVLGEKSAAQTLALAHMNDNRLADQEFVTDLFEGTYGDLSRKYGPEIADNRHVFAKRYQEIQDLKNAERSMGDVAIDSLIDTGLMAAQTIGGAAAVGVQAPDQILGTNFGPAISQGLESLSQWGQGKQSDLMQARRQIHAIEGELDKADSQAQYEEDAAQAITGWDKAVAKLSHYGRDFGNAIANYADDPIMAGSLVPEGIGSLIPATGAIKVLSKVKGISEIAAGTLVLGVTETGGAITQAQQEILSKNEEEMAESANYQALRQNGYSHDDAKIELAKDAGFIAGVTAAPGALMAGRVAAPFAANPLSPRAAGKGFGSSAAGAGRNLLSEGIEETLQEANSQFASNLGQRSTGFDVALDEGVASAAAEGLLGGLATAGPLQAPGVAVGTAAETGRAAVKDVKKLADYRDEQLDAKSPVGSAAQAESLDRADTAIEAVRSEFTQSEANQPTPEQIVVDETLNKAGFLDQQEIEQLSELLPEVAEEQKSNEAGQVKRSTAVKAMGKILTAKDTDPGLRVGVAIEMLASLNDMRNTDSDQVNQTMEALPEDSPARLAHQELQESVKTLESSPAAQMATEIMKNMTPEIVESLVPQDDPETASRIVETIGRYNPAAVDLSVYDRVLNQMGENNPSLRKSLKISREIAAEFLAAGRAKAQIEAEYEEVIETDPREKKRAEKIRERAEKQGKEIPKGNRITVDTVTQDIEVDGNSKNNMPSLTEHRRRVAEAISAGQFQQARDSMDFLGEFAQSRINKLRAYNESAEGGKGESKQFWSYGPFGQFIDDTGVYLNTKSANSVGLAKAAWVDTRSAVGLYNSLAKAYADELGGPVTELVTPDLHESVKTPKFDIEPVGEGETGPIEIDVPENIEEPAPVDDQQEGESVEADIDVIEPFQEPEAQQEPKAAPEAEPEPQPEAEVQAEPVVQDVIEETVEEPVTEDEPAADDQSNWFQGLKDRLVSIGSKANRFVTSFKPSKNGSTLMQHESPAAFILENLNNLVQENNALDRELTEAQKTVVSNLSEKTIPHFVKKLNDRLQAALDKDNGRRRKRLAKGEDIFGFREMLAAGLAVQDNKGNIVFDQALAEAASMALIEWLNREAAKGQPVLDNDKVAKAFGLPRGTHVTADMRAAAQNSTNALQAMEAMASTMEKLIGVQQDKTAPVHYTQGILKGVAANLLQIAEEGKLLTIYPVSVGDSKKPKTFNFVQLNKDASLRKDLDPLKTIPDVFTQVFTNSREKERYIGTPPKGVHPTQIKNDMARLTRNQHKFVERLQNIAFYLNEPVIDLSSALGGDVLAELLGYVKLPENPEQFYNKADLISIQGKNAAIISGLKGVEDYHTAVEEAGGPVYDTPVFFDWRISKVGRAQMQGPVTPQGDKIMREMLTATNSLINLEDPTELDLFYLAVAQAVGISVEKDNHSNVLNQIQEMLDGELRPAISALKSWKQTNRENPGEKIGLTKFQKEALTQTLQNLEQADMSMKLVHALVQVADAELALDEGGDAANFFKTTISLEADGKTDGPVNAMVHMMTGEFDDDQLRRLAKGGLFIGEERTSLNSHITGTDDKDLYNEAQGLFMTNLVQHLRGMSDLDRQTAAEVLAFLDAFLPDNEFQFSLGEDRQTMNLEIGRNLVKNPLTVFLYGSSDGGIANKVATNMMAHVYKTMTEIQQGLKNGTMKSWKDHPKFNKELGGDPRLALTFDKIINGSSRTTNVAAFLQKPESAELSAAAMSNMQDVLEKVFIAPMVEAIDEATGGLQQSMKFTQAAAQVQTIFFRNAYNRLVEERRANEDAPLSYKDYTELFEEASAIAPIYENFEQTFHIASAVRNSSDVRVSESFDGQLSAGATLPEPGEASVKVSPYLTIGLGDGQMIMNIYLNADGSLDTSLPVFDGVELAVPNMKEGSRQINKASFDGWMGGNIYESIADGFEQMTSRIDFGVLNDEEMTQLSRALGLQRGTSPSQSMINDMAVKLRQMSNEAKARKEALKKMHLWVDHMASADSPYEHKGAVVPEADRVKQLNIFYNEELAKLDAKAGKKAARPAVQKPNAQLQKQINQIGEAIPGTDVMAVRGDVMRSIMTDPLFRALDPEYLKGVTFYVGSDQDLATVKADLGIPESPVYLGQAYPQANVVFIANVAHETILHEALHLITDKVLLDHYDTPDKSPAHVRDAVKRLEALRKELMSMSLNTENQNVRDAVTALRNQMDRLEADPAAAMGEFISWTLSNQNIVDLAKKTKVRSPLVKVLRSVLEALRSLLNLDPKVGPGTTLFSNVRFNTAVLTASRSEAGIAEIQNNTDRMLNQVYGSNLHLEKVEKAYLTKLSTFIQATRAKAMTPSEKKIVDVKTAKLRLLARDATNHVISMGYALNAREVQAFQAVHSVMMSGMQMDASTMSRISKLYNHVVKMVSVEDFMRAEGIDPEQADDADRTDAALRHAALTGSQGIRKSANGRSDLLATFMGLALVDEPFRKMLRDLAAPSDVKFQKDSVDRTVEAVGETAMNLITRFSVSRGKAPGSIGGQLDVLGEALSEIEGERRYLAMFKYMNVMEKANDYAAEKLEKGTGKLVNFLAEKRKTMRSPKAQKAAAFVEAVASLGSEETSKATGDAYTSMLNQTPRLLVLRELLAEIRGTTDDNVELVKLINLAKSTVDALRQDFRETIPDQLAKNFSRKLSRQEWHRLYMGVARADLLALERSEARYLMADPTKLDAMIANEEEALQGLSVYNLDYKDKAQALAEFMVTRKRTSNNLLRNAKAIAHLFGEKVGPDAKDVTPELIKSIDRLTSLYAYQKLDDVTKETLKTLMETESEGIRKLVGYQAWTRQQEQERAGSIVGENNGWKGHVPTVTLGEGSLIVADDAKHDDLVRMGYTRVKKYAGSGYDGFRGTRSYYRNNVSVRNAFRQGVAQTVHQTFQGVDARTGQTQAEFTTGLIVGKAAERISKSIHDGVRNNRNDKLPDGDHLLPIFNEVGEIVAYERSMDPEMLAGLRQDTHLGRMLGVWSGRILEEREADKINRDLIETLKEIHDKQADDKADEFVNIADPKHPDPIVRDAWKTMGYQIKADAFDVFGRPNYLPVRRDMINDAIGFRTAGISDFWTGTTRFNEPTQKAVKDTLIAVMGNGAYKYLNKAQSTWSDVVSYAKTTIIIRSVLVGTQNIVSNVLHLAMHGIDPITGARGLRDKFVEITEYVKNKEMITRLKADLAAEVNQPAARHRIEARIKALEDVNNGLSIKKLLDVGEFSTISESLTEEDLAIREGRFSEYLEKAVDRLPGWSKTAAKNIVVSKDTALFKGLNRMVQYGDFVAKAVLYDHLMAKRGMTQEQALRTISEEFVNYNRLSGRVRDTLESLGLMWFYNYKIRIMKIAAKMLREKPLTSLLYAGGLGPATDIDTVFSGSLLGNVADGSLGYSIGPEMAGGALTLNPVYNVMN